MGTTGANKTSGRNLIQSSSRARNVIFDNMMSNYFNRGMNLPKLQRGEKGDINIIEPAFKVLTEKKDVYNTKSD
jgi:hypothetical protein